MIKDEFFLVLQNRNLKNTAALLLLMVLPFWGGQMQVAPDSLRMERIWQLLEDSAQYERVIQESEVWMATLNAQSDPVLYGNLATAGANALRRLNRPMEAVALHHRAWLLRKNGADKQAHLNTCRNLANCYLDANDSGAAARWIKEGLQLMQQVPDLREDQGDFWETTAGYYQAIQDWENAQQYYEKSLHAAHAAENPDNAWRLTLELAKIYAQRGQYRRADTLLVRLSAAIRSPEWQQQWYYTAGCCARAAGQSAVAQAYFEKAAQAASPADPALSAESLVQLGDCLLEKGDFVTGMDYFLRADTLMRADTAFKIAVLQRMALGWRYRGYPEHAATAIEEALQLLQQQQSTAFRQQTAPVLWLTAGSCQYEAGNFAAAMSCFQQCQQYTLDARSKAHLFYKMGVCYSKSGQSGEAAVFFQKSLDIAVSVREKDLIFANNYYLGEQFLQQKNWQQAKRYFAAAAAAMALQPGKWSDQHPFEQIQIENMQLRVLTGQARVENTQHAWKSVLQQAKTLIPQLARLKNDYRREESQLNLQDIFYQPFHAAAEAALALGQPEQALQFSMQYKGHVITKILGASGVSNLPYLADFPATNALRTQLEPGQVLLDYLYGDQFMAISLLSRDTFLMMPLAKPAALDSVITAFYRQCSRNPDGPMTNAERRDGPLRLSNAGKALYQVLLKPLAPLLTHAKEVVVVPDGLLWYVPFEALIPDDHAAPDDYSADRWLLSRFQISYAQNAVQIGGPRPGQRSAPRNVLAAFAPAFNAADTTYKPLKNNMKEAGQVHDLLGGHCFLNEKATKKAFFERSADSRILLLATHAWFDNAQPDHSAIVLSNENQDNLHDKLFVYELKQLSIPADLVILSACQTAQGRLYRGEGLMSIARAFLYAGAGSVVATRWNADDAETPVLIGHFVKNLCAGMRRSAALTKARYDFMQARQGSGHPYYWAGLMLTGERGVIQDLKGRSFGYWWWSGGAIVVVFLYFFTKKYKKRK